MRSYVCVRASFDALITIIKMVSSQIPRALRHAIQCLYQSGRSHGGLCGPHRGFVYVYVRVCGVSVWGWVGEGRVLAAGCAEALPPPLTLAHLFRGGAGLPLPRQARWRRSASSFMLTPWAVGIE